MDIEEMNFDEKEDVLTSLLWLLQDCEKVTETLLEREQLKNEQSAGDNPDMHPMQGVYADGSIARFRPNKIVRWMLEENREGRLVDMNRIARMSSTQRFTDDDHQQFAQLIGYSISGFEELSYHSHRVARIAWERWNQLKDEESREHNSTVE